MKSQQNKNVRILIIIVMVCLCTIESKVPDYVKLCSRNEDLKQCLMNNFHNIVRVIAKQGDPSLNVPILSDILVKRLPMQASKDLQITLTDLHCTGLEATQLKNIDFTDKELRLDVLVPRLELNGGYEMSGKILVLPIQGVGKVNLTLVNYSMEYKALLMTEEHKNKQYYYVDNNFESTEIHIKSIERLYYAFSNLFGGDPRLGPEMNLFLNDNWAEVYHEVQGAFEQGIGFSLMHPVINGFLRHIPINNLFS